MFAIKEFFWIAIDLEKGLFYSIVSTDDLVHLDNIEIIDDIINCNENNNIYGSCRLGNKECKDFVTKDFCNKYNKMIWSNKTCNESF